jgi:hypothetical protein
MAGQGWPAPYFQHTAGLPLKFQISDLRSQNAASDKRGFGTGKRKNSGFIAPDRCFPVAGHNKARRLSAADHETG